ncbi:Factor of DNA methylation 1 [Linum perenne]
MVTSLCHLQNASKLKPLIETGAALKEKLVNTGFDNILEMFVGWERMTLAQELVDLTISLYNPKSSCFEIGEHKLFFGLQAVLNILGLPVVGAPVVSVQKDDRSIAQDLFGDPEVWKNGSFPSSKLIKIVCKSDENVDVRVRATVLAIMACFTVPDATRLGICPQFGQCVRNTSKIKEYAWGEHVVVELHHALVKHKLLEEKRNETGGCMFAAVVFLLHHSPTICEHFGIAKPHDPKQWPLAKAWAKSICDRGKNPYRPSRPWSDLKDVDVQYNVYEGILLPEPYKSQSYMWKAISPMFSNNLCVYHTPYAAPKQFNISQKEVTDMEIFYTRTIKAAIEKQKGAKLRKDNNICFSLPGFRGGGNKDYFSMWQENLYPEVMQRGKQALLDGQNWVEVMERREDDQPSFKVSVDVQVEMEEGHDEEQEELLMKANEVIRSLNEELQTKIDELAELRLNYVDANKMNTELVEKLRSRDTTILDLEKSTRTFPHLQNVLNFRKIKCRIIMSEVHTSGGCSVLTREIKDLKATIIQLNRNMECQEDLKQRLEEKEEQLTKQEEACTSILNQMEKLKESMEAEKQECIRNSNEKYEALREKLEEKEEALQFSEDLSHALVVKEFAANQELQDAHKESISGLQEVMTHHHWSSIGIKRMGEIKGQVFREACLGRFSVEEVDDASAKLCSLWEQHLTDPHWHPFKHQCIKDQQQACTIEQIA